MERTPNTKSYDLIKFIVAVLLLIIIIILSIFLPSNKTVDVGEAPTAADTVTAQPSPTQEPQPTETSAPALPPFSEPSQGLTYDEGSKCLVNSEGEPLYCLNQDGTGWIPVVPDEIAGQFPLPIEPSLSEEGQWILTGENDDVIFFWVFTSHSWVLVEREQTVEITPIPPVTDCPGALPPRLAAGDTVRVTTNLNFRTSPGLLSTNWIQTNLRNTILTVLGETACTEYDFGSYRWWKVQLEDGAIGWSAEGSATGTLYFLEPLE